MASYFGQTGDLSGSFLAPVLPVGLAEATVGPASSQLNYSLCLPPTDVDLPRALNSVPESACVRLREWVYTGKPTRK